MNTSNRPSAASLINSNSAPGISNLQEGQSQVLNDISELQNMELEYFNQLNDGLTNNTLSQSEKDDLTQKINELAQMRINLYTGINKTYNFLTASATLSRNTMDEQTAAIQIVENELNEAKRRLRVIEEEKQNKLRLVEISTYYGQKYSDHSSIMKIVIGICIPILILTFLYNRGLLRSSVYGILFVIIGVIGLIILGRHLLDSAQRDNMYYDEYSWGWQPPASKVTSTSSSTDPWDNGGRDTCIQGTIDSITNSLDSTIIGMTGK